MLANPKQQTVWDSRGAAQRCHSPFALLRAMAYECRGPQTPNQPPRGDTQIPMKKWLLIAFLIGNVVVLLGQLWPGEVPQLAGKANLVFLLATLVYFTTSFMKIRWKKRRRN